MKNLIAGLLALGTITAFAGGNCIVDFKFDLSDGAYNSSILKERNVNKIKRILKNKGYKIKVDSSIDSDYELNVSATRYYSCGYSASRATFRENMSVDTGYSINLKATNGNTVFSKEDSFSRIMINFPAMKTRNAMMRSIKQLPVCDYNQ